MNKEQFVEALGLLLTNTSFGIKRIRYDYDIYHEMAIIEFHDMPDYIVNITGDSNAAIISDVMKSLEAYIGY